MKIGIGCDPNAAALKTTLIKLCESLGHEVADMGSDDPIYANTAIAVAESVARGEFDRGILVCGTGLGMSIAANKVKGAYAALLTDVYSAKRAILSNDSNYRLPWCVYNRRKTGLRSCYGMVVLRFCERLCVTAQSGSLQKL